MFFSVRNHISMQNRIKPGNGSLISVNIDVLLLNVSKRASFKINEAEIFELE